MADRTRVAVLISGRGSNMAALIYAARADDCPFEVALVTGDKPDAPGLALAEAEGTSVDRLASGQTFWTDLQASLDAARIDLIALAGFMRIIPDEFVRRWAGRMINIHPSLLPRHKGLRTHQAVLAAGETTTGATVHLVTPELDSGEILGQVEVAVLADDTPDDLATRVLIAEHQLYPRILAQFASRERDPAWIEERVGALALALPETRFKTSHGAPGWKVGSPSSDKFFAIMCNRHHSEDSIGLLVKCSGQDEMAQLIEAEPALYFRPAYYGPSDWIGIRLDRARVDWGHVGEWLQRSWGLCAPARLTKLMRAADEF
ncbi:phosphoribosylglycinamide formyltransferase [Sphingomonas sp. LY160]|uniref:phosphoribosylglycinamide formyltransferase n=1 Tax=Sphingomonas sp. LY160 TaxID=3095342 RepID=UPI002ADEBF83|nr:phosphoribosylglycinamide formyltransferase [Sphingomonas sp. LY160]MEA1071332.1 phosphoribosylglycinamide formyltransferase [Sphingomonas sp. LY160]